jgi:hypothetical protein
MCPFLKEYRFNQNTFLQSFAKTAQPLPISQNLRQELTVWAKCRLAEKSGFPIPVKRGYPPLKPLQFISDAAGTAMSWENGNRSNTSTVNERGVALASLGFDADI